MSENTGYTTPQAPAPQPRSNTPMIVGIVAVVAIVGFVVLQMMTQRSTTQQPAPPQSLQEEDMMIMDHSSMPAGVQSTTEEVSSEASAVALTVEGGSYYYKPNIIRVKKGATVTITLNSVDMMHDFVIDELGVESEIIGAGDTTTVTFVADEAGEFEFYCSVSDHRAMGMVGTLIVEE